MTALPSPAPSVAASIPRLGPAPAGADRNCLRQEGVPAVLRVLIEGIWDRRPVVLYGEEPQAAQEVWGALAKVRSREDWEAWLALARTRAWGKPVPWSAQVEEYDLIQKRQAWQRARQLLGPPLALWLQEDQDWMSWWSAAQSRLSDGDDRLERRERVLDQKRSKARPNPQLPLPPADQCSLASLRQDATRLAQRFGLRHLEAAAGMPLWCMREHLQHAEKGLQDLAQALGWDEKEVGGLHLGLGWELGPKDMAGAYDPLQHMVFLGREDWFGSFAHEFAHALDRVAADPSQREPYLSQQRANDVFREEPALSGAQRVYAQQEIIRGFYAAYKKWRVVVPLDHPRLAPLDADISTWVERVLDPTSWSSQQRSGWDRWRARMTLALTNAPKAWVAQFDALCQNAEYLWDNPPRQEGWVAWAQAMDVQENKTYWAAPHELWARAFHAIIANRVEEPGWLASSADESCLFPCRSELRLWQERLDEDMDLLHKAWKLRGEAFIPRRMGLSNAA